LEKEFERRKKELYKKSRMIVKDYVNCFKKWQLDRSNLNYSLQDKYEILCAILNWQNNKLKEEYEQFKKEYEEFQKENEGLKGKM
jgi:hypothetical protein